MHDLHLLQYWGADWISMLAGFVGNWMTARRNRTGFALLGLANAAAVFCALWAQQWGFIFANAVNIAIGIYGWRAWRGGSAPQAEKDEIFPAAAGA